MPDERESPGGGGWARPVRLIVGALLLMLYFGALGRPPLLEPDEGRYTEIPREMLARHDFVTPHLDGVLYFEKPPLYYWFNALSIRLFGINEFSSRFWSAAFGLLGLGLAYLLGRRCGGRAVGEWSALTLATSLLYLALSHLAIIDMTLTFFFSLTMTCFWLAWEATGGWKERLLWYGMFLGAALTVLSKGLMGIALPGAIAFLTILLTSGWAVLKRVPWVSGTLLFLAVALPWHVLAQIRNPDFFSIYIVREHFLRYLTPVSDRQEPFWFFLPVVALGLLPWSGLLLGVPSLLGGLPLRRALRERRAVVFLVCWAGFLILFFSASQSKLIPYVLPAFPPLAVLAAMVLLGQGAPTLLWRRLERAGIILGCLLVLVLGAALAAAGLGRVPAFDPSGRLHLLLLALGILTVLASLLAGAAWLVNASSTARAYSLFIAGALLFAAIWAAAPQIAVGRSSKAFVPYLQAHLRPGDRLFSFNYYPQTLPVYLHRLMDVADFQGELAFGISKLPPQVRENRFPDAAQFKKIWDSGQRVYLVTDHESLPRMKADGLDRATVLEEQRTLLLLTNRPEGQ